MEIVFWKKEIVFQKGRLCFWGMGDCDAAPHDPCWDRKRWGMGGDMGDRGIGHGRSHCDTGSCAPGSPTGPRTQDPVSQVRSAVAFVYMSFSYPNMDRGEQHHNPHSPNHNLPFLKHNLLF